MEFACHRDDLAKGIATVERAVAVKENMPSLEGILMHAEGDRLRLVATDLEMSIECLVPARVEQEGKAVLSGKIVGQIVRKMPVGDIGCKSDAGGLVQIASERSQFTVHTISADDFPEFPDVSAEETWRIRQSELRRMVRQTAFAAASDEARPFLTGVLIEVDGAEIRFVSTDSNRLAFRRGQLLAPASKEASGIVPVRALLELLRIMDGDDESEVEIALAKRQALFKLDGARMVSRVIEGQFPAYQRVFPEDQPTKIRADREEFLAAVERVSLVARRNTPVVRLKASEGTLYLNCKEAEVGEAKEEISIDHEGPDVETSYQARYVIEALRVMEGDSIQLELGDGLRQGKLAPIDDSRYIYIVMPVRVG